MANADPHGVWGTTGNRRLSPGEISSLAASLAESTLSAGSRGVLLSIAAATGRDCTAHLSAGRLAARCGLSRGHIQRVLKQLTEGGFLTIENMPGRASLLTVHPPEGCSAGAPSGADTPRAHVTGVARQRDRGVAPARHISSNSPSNKSVRTPSAGPDGPPSPALDADQAEQERLLLIQLRQLRQGRA